MLPLSERTRLVLKAYYPYRMDLLLALGAFLIKALPLWLLPLITANIIDALVVARTGSQTRVILNGGAGAIAVLLNIPAGAVYARSFSRAIRGAEADIRHWLIAAVQRRTPAQNDFHDFADLPARFLRDLESIETFARQFVENGIFAVAGILVALGVVGFRRPILLPILSCFLCFMVMTRRLLYSRLKGHFAEIRLRTDAFSVALSDTVSLFALTRAHGAERTEKARLAAQIDGLEAVAIGLDSDIGIGSAIAWTAPMCLNLLILAGIAALALDHIVYLFPGDFVLLATYLMSMIGSVVQLASLVPAYARAGDACECIARFIQVSETGIAKPNWPKRNVSGAIELRDVCFRYTADGGQVWPLRGVTLELRPGECTCVAGPSGSGKTTLVKVVCGLLQPTSGLMLLDGVDCSRYSMDDIRCHFGYVNQLAGTMRGSVRDVVSYGLDSCDDKRIIRALEEANAMEFVARLSHGLNTALGPGGVGLSGGQKQRIALARALVRKPRILILDEPTSGLDPSNRDVIVSTLSRLGENRTTLIVCHDAECLSIADKMYRMEAGSLAPWYGLLR